MTTITKQENVKQENTVKTGNRIRQEPLAYITWMIGTIAISLIFGLQSFYPQDIALFSNIAAPIAAGVSFVTALFCVRKYGFGFGRFSRVWVFVCPREPHLPWLRNQSGRFYNFVLNVAVPYPSVADIFYVAAYVPPSRCARRILADVFSRNDETKTSRRRSRDCCIGGRWF